MPAVSPHWPSAGLRLANARYRVQECHRSVIDRASIYESERNEFVFVFFRGLVFLFHHKLGLMRNEGLMAKRVRQRSIFLQREVIRRRVFYGEGKMEKPIYIRF